MKVMTVNILMVGAGGAAGSIFRYLVSLWMCRFNTLHGFPLATFTANITGCILIGILAGLASRMSWMDANMKLLLITGFCGGYTTFSTFSLENIQLFENRQFLVLTLYIAASILFGTIGVFLGNYLVKS